MNDKEYIFSCPSCHVECCLDSHDYCVNCGEPIMNYCVNENCKRGGSAVPGGNRLSKRYCHCPDCGEKTAYCLAGIISPIVINYI